MLCRAALFAKQLQCRGALVQNNYSCSILCLDALLNLPSDCYCYAMPYLCGCCSYHLLLGRMAQLTRLQVLAAMLWQNVAQA
jgi:hypothetical protein